MSWSRQLNLRSYADLTDINSELSNIHKHI